MLTRLPRLVIASALLLAACDTSSVEPTPDGRSTSPTIDARDPDPAIDAPDPTHDAPDPDPTHDAPDPTPDAPDPTPDAPDPAPDAPDPDPVPTEVQVIDISTPFAGVHIINPNLVEWPDFFGLGRDWYAELRNDGPSRFCPTGVIVDFYDIHDARISFPGLAKVAPSSFTDVSFPGECLEPGTSAYIFTWGLPTPGQTAPVATVKVHYYGFVSEFRPATADPVVTATRQNDRAKGTVKAAFALSDFRVSVLAFDATGTIVASAYVDHEDALPANTEWSYTTFNLEPVPTVPTTLKAFITERL